MPVFNERIDNIVGITIAYAMDLLGYLRKGELLENSTVGELARKPACFVPGNFQVLDYEINIWKTYLEVEIQ